MLADQVTDPLVLRMHRNRGIAQHGFGAGGRHHDEACGIIRTEGLALDRIAQIPEVAPDLDLLDLKIGYRRQKFRIPVDEPLVLVDQTFTVQLDEYFHDRARQALVHRETFARPVAGRAQPLQLVDDGAATLGLPLPDPFEEFGASHVAAARLLPFHQLPLDHHLGRDAGMVGAGLPQDIPSAHPLEAAEDVLQGVVQRVAHVQRARHVGRRNHDGEGFCVPPFGAAGLERTAFVPDAGHAAFDIGGLVIFFDHDSANEGCGTR